MMAQAEVDAAQAQMSAEELMNPSTGTLGYSGSQQSSSFALDSSRQFSSEMNLNGSVPPDEKSVLPRDILMQKIRQYRESQTVRENQPRPEQLSMNVENSPESSLEMARRLANEIVKSPFDTRNLDVPAFLRRKQQQPRSEEEGDNLPLG